MKRSGGKDPLTATPGFPIRAAGFSLVELLIAAAVGLVVLGAMYSVFTIQNKTFGNQEQIVELQQNVRAAMDMMIREIRMAGYDPIEVNSDSDPANNFSGVPVNASQLQVRADQNSDGAIDATSEENIVYAYNAANKQITRNIGAGAQPFAENIDAFTFAYLDGNGNVTAVSADVRRIEITITGRTARPDPAYTANGGYRTYTLTSVIALRN
ncbi:MAG: prepilin-type N-terminal cleavage/methylation domain-containing protein [Deltaproteobacteria bacterium]|nr:prepilin-type N-terminal cleavage/methylation domain-containing protein [Deltaproteobacteria bacterium]